MLILSMFDVILLISIEEALADRFAIFTNLFYYQVYFSLYFPSVCLSTRFHSLKLDLRFSEK